MISAMTTNYKELKFASYLYAKKKQSELMRMYGYKPKIFHLRDEEHWLIVKPIELIKLKEKKK